MKKTLLNKAVLTRLFPLFFIVITVLAGFSLILYRNATYRTIEHKLQLKIQNLTARMAIGSSIVQDIQNTKTIFFQLIVLHDDQQQRVLVQASNKLISHIRSSLQVLQKGGVVVTNFPLNTGGTDVLKIDIKYQPDSPESYTVATLELFPALLELEKKIEGIVARTTVRNQILLNVNYQGAQLARQGRELRHFVSITAPLFKRMLENSYKILSDGEKQLEIFSLEKSRLQKEHTDAEAVWAVGSIITVLFLIGLVLRQMYSAQHDLEQIVVKRTTELTRNNKRLGEEIEARQKIENSLRKSKGEWERTFDAIPDIITIQDMDFRIIRANKAASRHLNLSWDKIVDHHCHEIFHDAEDPCPNCPLLLTKTTFRPYSHKIFHEKLNKTFFVSAAPIFNEQGHIEYLTHVARDISKEVSLEQQLRQAVKMEAIGTLAGGIAHDFNNILASILGYGEMAKVQLEDESQAQKDVQQIIRAGKRARDLVRQILSFSRQGDIQFSPLKIQFILREALKLLRSSLPVTIRIEEQIDNNCGPVLADSTQIHQIIINLCTNAKQAMGSAGGVLSVALDEIDVAPRVQVSGGILLQPGSYVHLMIEDTGCGMDAETQERIFDPFFTTKNVGEGTGLGLSVIHGIVKQHEGEIGVESVLGEGTIFHIYLPVTQREIFDRNNDAEETVIGNENILLVDDEVILLEAMRRLLELLGYTVTACSSAVDAFEKFSASPDGFDLLITDMTMPEMTGVELTGKILQVRSDLPVVMVTGYSESIDAEHAKNCGVNEFIMKPVSKKQLLAAINNACCSNSRRS